MTYQRDAPITLRNFTAVLLVLAGLTGCRQDMQDQPKFYPQRGTSLFADGRSSRFQVNGTVARSQDAPTDYFNTGLQDGKEADGLPVPLNMDTMRRGQERFNIFCTPCHSRVGNGQGMIVQRGYYAATSFHSTRLRDAPLGHFFQVMTHGYGAMPNYAAEIAPADRWAIAAYIRALQLSQNAKATDIDDGQRAAKLSEVLSAKGFGPSFMDPWGPSSRSTTSSTVASPVPVQAAALPMLTPTAPNHGTELVPKAGLSVAPSKAVSPSEGQLTNSSLPAAVKPAEAKQSLTAGPAKPPVDIEEGQSIYMHNCAACHQISRAGLPPNIPTLIGIVPKVGEERIRAVVIDGMPNGKPPMPPFTRLSREDIDNLIGFLSKSK